jgi:RimJ/RimL family protein N-acetyltransferase
MLKAPTGDNPRRFPVLDFRSARAHYRKMELHTDRLLLREFNTADWQAVLAYQRDPRYLRYYDWTDRTPGDAQRFVQMFIEQQAEQPRRKFQLAVVLKETGDLIGNGGLRKAAISALEANLGYELSPDHWGRGYATEAVRAIVQFGFTELKVHRVWAWCIADNLASARVLEKLGLKLEGRLRDKEYFKGRWWDTLLYGILENEWHG